MGAEDADLRPLFAQAALQIERTKEVEALWRRLWSERLAAVDPLFEQAIARGEIASDIDREAVFGALAGAVYFRLIVSGQRGNDAWIRRVLDAVLGSA
jgi:hypothetical protein